MEQILQKMEDIEESVKTLLEHTSIECKNLQEQADKECADYDAASAQQAQEKVLAIQSEIQKKQEQDIKKLQSDTTTAISSLNMYFEENHEHLSKEIFQTILSK